MARTAINPRVLTTPSPQGLPLKEITAVDSKTWDAGEFGEIASGTGSVQPVASASSTASYCIFADDQSTSTTGSEKVWVNLLVDNCELEMYVYDNNQVSAIDEDNVNVRYGVQTVSNITYLDLNQTTGQFEVMDKASTLMPERSAYDGGLDGTTGTTAGLCKVKFRKNVS